MHPYTLQDITKNIGSSTLSQGKQYYKQGRVTDISHNPGDELLRGAVRGNSPDPYDIEIMIIPRKSKSAILEGVCSCPVGYNCKHVAAVLLAALPQQQKNRPQAVQDETEQLDNVFLETWLKEVETALKLKEQNSYPASVKQRMLYLLSLEVTNKGTCLVVQAATATIKKNGDFSTWKNYNIQHANKPFPAKFLQPDDLSILRRLLVLNQFDQHFSIMQGHLLAGKDGRQLLEDMLTTGRCFWQEPTTPPLVAGKERRGTISWKTLEDGSQQVQCTIAKGIEEIDAVFPLHPPFYLDKTKNHCGVFHTDLSDTVAATLLQAPAIPAVEAEAVRKRLNPHFKGSKTTLPRLFEKTKPKKIKPIPHLHLFMMKVRASHHRNYSWARNYTPETPLPAARLSFLYENKKISHFDQTPTITTLDQGKLLALKRHKGLELSARKQLKESGFISAKKLETLYSILQENSLDFTMSDDEGKAEDADSIYQNWLQFSLKTLPGMRKQGWNIEIDADFPFNLVHPDDSWYSEVDDSTGIDWFEVELGVMVQGEKLNLLPILLTALKSDPQILDNLDQVSDKGSLLCPMPDGSRLVLPVDRTRTILSFLKDLYNFENLEENGKLKLSRLEAADLAEFDAATKAINLRWFGGERVKALGQQLKNFTGITSASPPQGFQTTLRNYQQEGLNWLQFLRKYQLAGILADDMGLGKTVQTLAHIALEKEQNRLTKPVLIISPTSVLPNWQMEAERLTPNLSLLTLHGTERKTSFAKIKDYDLVLTTYPLLSRDKEALLKESYHTIVLDEAQYIKNAKSQMSLVACQLKADNRLCLTGTPMENHLGELWSLFNFLMPGLLGDEKKFRQFYRNPIEKEQDDDRRKALIRRIKPFMIRRTKDMVATELPQKTEIIQNSELTKVQRDLYETIRISMHEKVRKEIANKGLGRSHIIVLDALLKLRQVCCDPRLLKLEAAKKVKHSAKLEQLMEMLPEMLEEGRKVLLFSQFTSMLKLIEEALQKKKIDYVKLTGQTKDRKTPISIFQNGNVPLFLISLKAGGTGLNLTAADTVIHYDPWWNPAVENQATDRAHRIGQEKPVFVYKLITTGTVEEKILQLQEKKKALAEGIFNPESKTAKKLTVDDINALFEPMK